MKITITDLPDEQRWSLHGELAGQWAIELRSTWKDKCDPTDSRRCVFDLSELTLIDYDGEAVVAEIMSQGAHFIATDVYTKHLLLKLRGELRNGK